MQPVLASDKGVILSVGMLVSGDLCAVTIPCATDNISATPQQLCKLAVDCFDNTLKAEFLDLMAPSAEIRFARAIGMDDGNIPYEKGYLSGVNVGTVTGDGIPASLGGLVTMYIEPADATPGHRLRHSRMIVPGLSKASLDTRGWINATYQASMLTLVGDMVGGFSDGSGVTFYRVLNSPPRGTPGHTPGTNLMRLTDMYNIRWYPGTQRKRIIPH